MRNQGFWQLLQAYSSYRQWSLDFRSALSIDQDRSRPIDGHSGCTQVFECALSKVRSASQITTVIARLSRAHSKSWVHTRPIFMAGGLLILYREWAAHLASVVSSVKNRQPNWWYGSQNAWNHTAETMVWPAWYRRIGLRLLCWSYGFMRHLQPINI